MVLAAPSWQLWLPGASRTGGCALRLPASLPPRPRGPCTVPRIWLSTLSPHDIPAGLARLLAARGQPVGKCGSDPRTALGRRRPAVLWLSSLLPDCLVSASRAGGMHRYPSGEGPATAAVSYFYPWRLRVHGLSTPPGSFLSLCVGAVLGSVRAPPLWLLRICR